MLLFYALCTCASWGQKSPPGAATVVDIASEPHHHLIFKNDEVRVFRLKLQSHEATLRHRHGNYYAYLSLRRVTIAMEVRGRQPVLTRVEAGELHTSKGGFIVAERDQSAEPADLLVIEALKHEGKFDAPMGSFRYHDAAFSDLFESPSMRGYAMTIAAGGRTDEHREIYDRLLIAVSDLKLQETLVGQTPVELDMKAGETRWMPHGTTHTTSNIGTSPAVFITLEFN